MNDVPKKHKILIVDDDDDIRQALCFFLKFSDFDVLDVSGSQQAIDVLPTYWPDLIVLDIMMQPVNGWKVLHWLREHHLTPLLPVLVLTARVHLTEQLQGFEEGAVDYLTKPTQTSIIAEHIHTLLSLSVEQRKMLQRKRIEEQRKRVERIVAPLPHELVR
jgi:DNA-binding response OmpR family regulator